MLEVLKIKNIAIIDTVEIQFKPGLNILSGETGAGKSIVIEAISLLLGSRARLELIRSGCEEAVVEGLFQIAEIPWIRSRLKQTGFNENSSELLVKRTVHRSGKHRISVNGELATLSTLQSLCEGLIDLCGQHEHQSLLRPQVQLELLDRYGGLTEQAKRVAELWAQVKDLTHELNQLQKKEQDRNRRVDFLKFQIEEIRAADLQWGEDEDLLKEKQLLQSSETRAQLAEVARIHLESEETGVLQSLKVSLQKLKALILLDSTLQPHGDALERAFAETEDVVLALNRYLASIDLNSERLQSIQERLSVISDLKRKYGSQIGEILSTLEVLEKEFSDLQEMEDLFSQLMEQFNLEKGKLFQEGQRLSRMRMKVSELFSNSVTAELKDLKMDEAKFHIELFFKENISEWNSSGGDSLQFMVQTNRGEHVRPLGKIVSGGELSRLMLSLRRVIADQGGIGVYLFDEIDAGIGGQTAFQVGKKLKSVSVYNQVICITHLPQVASFADYHWVVRKTSRGKRTVTEIKALNRKEKKEEIARMLGGPQLTPKSLENASELLELARI